MTVRDRNWPVPIRERVLNPGILNLSLIVIYAPFRAVHQLITACPRREPVDVPILPHTTEVQLSSRFSDSCPGTSSNHFSVVVRYTDGSITSLLFACQATLSTSLRPGADDAVYKGLTI